MNKIIYSLVYNRKKCLNKRSRSLFRQKEEILFNQSLSETGTMGCKKTSCKKPP